MKRFTSLLLIVYLLCAISPALSYGAVLLDRIVAVVNNDVITWSELRQSIEQEMKEPLAGLKGEEREKALKELERNFLQRMIDVRLQVQEAKRIGIDVRAAELEEAVSDIKKKYNLKDEDFIATLRAEGFTLEEYKGKLSEQILLGKIVSTAVRSNVFVTDKEVADYYNANKEKYTKAESIRIRQILFNLPKEKAQKARLEATAQEILKRLRAGEDFAKLAEEFSDDPSKKFGGDLGYINRGSILKEMEDVAFGLKEGEVSSPFWSQKGLHIIKLEHRLDPSNPEKAKSEIKEILYEKAFRIRYEEWVKELRARAYIEINL
ncbi:MAG: peptidylprolyl isomerase [Nitrospirae bacterium]|nr:peptidylprolyl isomerase [Nitrospirota bacterium]